MSAAADIGASKTTKSRDRQEKAQKEPVKTLFAAKPETLSSQRSFRYGNPIADAIGNGIIIEIIG